MCDTSKNSYAPKEEEVCANTKILQNEQFASSSEYVPTSESSEDNKPRLRSVIGNYQQVVQQKRKADSEEHSPPLKRRKENHSSSDVAVTPVSEYTSITEEERVLSEVKHESRVEEESLILKSEKAEYLLLEFLGEGCFGKVVKCFNKETKQVVAMKITDEDDFIEESIIWKQLLRFDTVQVPIVRVLDLFQLEDEGFMVFELLDQSLHEFLKNNTVPIEGVRRILRDLLQALAKLKEIGIIHTDIKLDNIMLVDHGRKPFSVKLIDFGLAIDKKRGKFPKKVQSLRYKAPEVLLRLPYNEAIDMWAIGCVIGAVLTGSRLYPGTCEYDVMRLIHAIHGMPPQYMLNGNERADDFFGRIRTKQTDRTGSVQYKWKLKTPEKYYRSIGQKSWKIEEGAVKKLEDAVEINFDRTVQGKVKTPEDSNIRSLCTDLLKKMLTLDPERRISADDAVNHMFVNNCSCVKPSSRTKQ